MENKEISKIVSELYAKNYTEIVNYINWKVNNLHDAQDIAQDVFVKVVRYYENNYNVEKAPVLRWLRVITNRCIIDFYRTNQFGNNCINVTEFDDEETGQSFQFVDKNSSADKYINNKELSNKISIAFSTLNEGKERLIAHLYFIEEYEYKEIEELTMYPMGTIKGMINRIRMKLQTQLVA
jgi:RNA polymerase sigma-70 factor (ECF subfamily)